MHIILLLIISCLIPKPLSRSPFSVVMKIMGVLGFENGGNLLEKWLQECFVQIHLQAYSGKGKGYESMSDAPIY